MKETKVFFRVDGNSTIGLGHLIRCVSLGHLLKESFEISFIIGAPDNVALSLINNVSSTVFAIDGFNEIYQIIEIVGDNDILVLDGYNFDLVYQNELKNQSFKLVYIDDVPDKHMVADAVINYMPGIKAEDYSYEADTVLWLGLDYLMLRPPFLNCENQDIVSELPKNVVIALGGADPENISKKVIETLLELNKYEKIDVIIGGANQNEASLRKLTNQSSEVEIGILKNLDADQMVIEFLSHDLAICSASVTSMEVCALNKLLLSIGYVDNQKKVIEFLKTEKCAIPIESWSENGPQVLSNNLTNLSVAGIQEILDNQRKNFNNVGFGLLNIFNKLKKEMQLSLRRATERDVDLFFLWANDPDVRRNSTNKEKISLNDHTEWFTHKVKDSNHIFYLFELHNEPIAQLRFDVKKDSYWINYSISREYRGKGWSTAVIRLGVQKLIKENGNSPVVKAIVKYSNLASAKAFENCSFRQIDDCKIMDENYMVFIK
jgi:UDP-2,4-diacetamido-2,4,6-trideoxy-beta-L-altropyranose hydrolase